MVRQSPLRRDRKAWCFGGNTWTIARAKTPGIGEKLYHRKGMILMKGQKLDFVD